MPIPGRNCRQGPGARVDAHAFGLVTQPGRRGGGAVLAQNPAQGSERFSLGDALLHNGVEHLPVQLPRGAEAEPRILPPRLLNTRRKSLKRRQRAKLLCRVVQTQPVRHFLRQRLKIGSRLHLLICGTIRNPDANTHRAHQHTKQGRERLGKLGWLRQTFGVQHRRELVKRRASRHPDSLGTIRAAQRTIRKILSAAAQRTQSLRQLHRNMRLNHNLARLGSQGTGKGRSGGGESTNLNARLAKNGRLLKNIRKRRRIGYTSCRQRMPDAPCTRCRAATGGRTAGV